MAGPSLIDRLLNRTAKPTPAPRAPSPRQHIGRGRNARAEYDGATQSKRAAGWRRTVRDANGELTPAVVRLLRGIARDLVRNNPFASRGVAKIAESIVGTGVTFQVYRNGVIDDRLNAIARAHFDTTSCDASGRHDLYGLQLQAARTIVESGAAVVRRRWRRKIDGFALPFQLQILEPDYIDPSKNGPLAAAPGAVAGFLVNGIQFDPIGRREGYWLYNGHPGGTQTGRLGTTFIQAADIAHVFRADRPEQEHGATWLAPIVLRMRDFADYEDAQLTRQKLASAFVGVITGEDPDGAIPGIVTEGEDGQPVDLGPDQEPLDYIEPGTFQYARAGEEVNFSDPPSVDGYGDYTKVSLRAVAVGLGLPYEVLTGDLSNVSFISGRLGRLDFRDTVSTWQWLMFIPQFCGSVQQWFLDALEATGEDISGVTMRWTPPPLKMLDPASEVPAIRDAIRSGQMTVSSAARDRGEDPDTFLDEWEADAKRLDARGLIFDSDPRHVTAVGNPTNPTAAVQARTSREARA